MLFEGNYSFNYDSDNTHGNSIYHTVFRNHLAGFRRSYAGMSNARAGGLMIGSWWHSFVGNVMGTAGRMAGWTYTGGNFANIWTLGYDPQDWDQDADPQVLSTILREGNFDYVTNQVRWDTVAQALPNSLYLAAKPAFFGSNPWPWVDPTGTTKLYTLPAKARFESQPAVRGRFYTLPPCRVVDTRNPAGPLSGPALVPFATRDFMLVGYCGIPADARAVAANVTVVNPTSAGFVKVSIPSTPSLNSTVNVVAGKSRANSIVVGLSLGRSAPQPGVSVSNGLSTHVHFLLDVVGYFK
jgi:hypothetical protein